MTPSEILKKYWGYDRFRPLQEEIVQSVINKNDTLALLPTGGGKSICFQVPGMVLEGLTLVITPLIALMKDQVEQLKAVGIPAASIDSGMNYKEITIVLENAQNRAYKFLYLSPERIQTQSFTERLVHTKVGLLVVDEAHCISQWGYDFRPSYLLVNELRTLIPDVPCIAVTASATPEVEKDIVEKLHLKDVQIFRKSFSRPNLSYSVFREEDKERKLIDILQKVPGSSIVYVRSRNLTKQIANVLLKKKISANYYHAGLSYTERAQKQDAWIKNKVRVMVSTNAFGMGINKPDVRTVIHMDIPESLEAYYQEAGRAGRDEKKAYAVLLYQTLDVENLRQTQIEKFPEFEILQTVYQSLVNHFQIASGGENSQSFDFDLDAFSVKYKFDKKVAIFALKHLENQQVIAFNESYYSPSKLFVPDHEELYKFQVANAKFDPIIKAILRIYGGQLYTDFTNISEIYLSETLKIEVVKVKEFMNYINQIGLWIYIPMKDKPQITFTKVRTSNFNDIFSKKYYQERVQVGKAKAKSMINYALEQNTCRSIIISQYFGEYNADKCGVCDVCITARKTKEGIEISKKIGDAIMELVKKESVFPHELFGKLPHLKQNDIKIELQRLIEDKMLQMDATGKLTT
ncbi:MAG: ATP-dependent DNA helicase RecQ [Bacteroidota bacterium]|nr:ATP-dependent DNA helicase RecQ [Bacteroidota bacterium]